MAAFHQLLILMCKPSLLSSHAGDSTLLSLPLTCTSSERPIFNKLIPGTCLRCSRVFRSTGHKTGLPSVLFLIHLAKHHLWQQNELHLCSWLVWHLYKIDTHVTPPKAHPEVTERQQTCYCATTLLNHHQIRPGNVETKGIQYHGLHKQPHTMFCTVHSALFIGYLCSEEKCRVFINERRAPWVEIRWRGRRTSFSTGGLNTFLCIRRWSSP